MEARFTCYNNSAYLTRLFKPSFDPRRWRLRFVTASMPTSIYIATACKPAYQLRWSLSIFPQTLLPPINEWLNELQASTLRDHVHFTLEVGYDQSACEIVLSYMNQVAAAHGGLRLWMDSFYVGSIGPYDMGAVRKVLEVNRSPHRPGSE